MLFHPRDKDPYLFWQKRSEEFWQARHADWVAEMRSRPRLLELYKRWKELLGDEKYPDWWASPTESE